MSGPAGVGPLIERRRAEILAGLLACEPVGTPDPDETPENITEILLEWELQKAFGWLHTTPHEEVMREVLAPTYRWDAYRDSGPGALDDGERERLDDAGKVVGEVLGIGPEARVQADGAAITVADVIAALVLRREMWEEELRKHPRPWAGPIPG